VIPVLTTAELREVEERAKDQHLMERAGRAVADAARHLATDTGSPILVVAGPGNNGGDAWVAAALLAESFHRVIVFDVLGTAPKAAEARAARDRFATRGGSVVREWPSSMKPALVVDGLLGIGLTRDVDAALASAIERMNASGAPILAIDVPSGLDSQTGVVRGTAVRATHTITFIAHKVGLHTGDGLDHRGALECDDLGTASLVRDPRGSLLTAEVASPWLAPRAFNSHKGTFGTLAIIGGNRGMVGAALLAGRAGLLCGAGKVRVGLLSPDAPAVDLIHPELMLSAVDDALAADVIVAGPGAGQSPSATSVSMFERTVLPALINSAKPIVLDADALNAVAFNAALESDLVARKKGPTILTPHPGEAARLLHKSNADVNNDRLAAARALAKRFNADVVLKGAGSICASPDGSWSINTTGNPGLASGGSGDVLAGMVGAMLSQGLDVAKALRYAVCLHGAAADALAAKGSGPAGLTASEVALEARAVMNCWTPAG
jgi:hydroxyethylthiazole kinase-like uncharacterized protein yjeF